VTITGSGFGAVKGGVTVGGAAIAAASITSWTDTSITFTQRDVSPATGAQDVQVRAAESASALSNAAAFTFTP
jgi:hypothetical protein